MRRPKRHQRRGERRRLYGRSKKFKEGIRKKTMRRCAYCGVAKRKKQMTLDHIQPIVLGGESVASNLVACCQTCNTAKGSMDLETYRMTLNSPEAVHEFWFERKAIDIFA